MSENHKELQGHEAPRFRISGIAEGMTTLQAAEVLDLTPTGALVEHQGMFQPQSACLLQLGTNGDLSTIRCRVVNSRKIRSQPDGGLYSQTMVEFLELSPAAEQVLKTVIRSLGRNGGYSAGGP
ncbi:MAG: hypothetical protein ACE5IQ_08140 [Candidatus Methylomirabilales bacterium]